MIACLDTCWCGIRNLRYFIKPEFIVIPKVECQLLLGRQRENRLLQFHRHLIIKVDIIITLNQVDTCGFRFYGNNFLSPFADNPKSLICGYAINPASQRAIAPIVAERAIDSHEGFLRGILCIIMRNHQSAYVPVNRFLILHHQHSESVLRAFLQRIHYAIVIYTHIRLFS